MSKERRMSKEERLRKQSIDRANANRRHTDDPDYEQSAENFINVVATEKPKEKSSFEKAVIPATEDELGGEDAENFRRQKNLKDNEPEKLTMEEWEAIKSNKPFPKSKNHDLMFGNPNAGKARTKSRQIDNGEASDLEKGQTFFADRAGECMAYLAGFTDYVIPLDDGTELNVYRVSPPKYEIEEFKDMLADQSSGLDSKGKPFKTIREARLAEKMLEDKKFKMYLRHSDTDKPVGRDDILHAEDSRVPDIIAETCLAITLSRWVEGKKLEAIAKVGSYA